MTRTPKLTDTQLMLLSTASQRDDGLLDLASRLKGNPLQSTAEKLLKGGLAEEVSVDPDQPAWRSDEWESRIGLKITPAGLQAIGVEPESDDAPETQPAANVALPEPSALLRPSSEKALRTGSKKALVISLLNRESGATLSDLTAATGWLPHTTRAALTGLRKQGIKIDRHQPESGSPFYRVSAGGSDQPAPING
jgi:hypothetical protein